MPPRVAPTGLWDTSCHQEWDGSTWLRVQLCKAADALSGLAAGHSLLFVQHLLREGGSGSPFLCQQLWHNLGKWIFLCPLAMFALLRWWLALKRLSVWTEQEGSTNWTRVGAKCAAAIPAGPGFGLGFFSQLCSVKKVLEAQCVFGAQSLSECFLSAPLGSLHIR